VLRSGNLFVSCGRFVGIVNAEAISPLFASSALYPSRIMPYTPRKSMICCGYSSMQGDLLAIAFFVLFSMLLASRVFKRIIE